ncbi:MAG: dTDP-4-dehydro-6-deoxyglucose aminotransferase [Chloroflexi bacterium]|nr:dTDP-4-dehydro-6-deoxyglucose aminotransferase [Chloroflexota bacterium]
MKTRLTDLAFFGGPPQFAEPLHVGRPNIGNREHLMARINDMLDRRWFTNNGPYVQEFEQKLARYMEVKHAVAMTNATIALEIAVRALDIKGEVILPSFTFIATAHALQWQEITPVFCDVAPGTHHIDPNRVEHMITPRTTAIIGVHVWGSPCPIDELTEIAKRRGLHLIFDAAHAIGCSYKGRMIGGFGEAEIVSFHSTKFLNSFEGGAVLTNDDTLADRMRYMRNFGFAGVDRVDYVGTNGKMTEIAAAMGLTSLESIDEIIAANKSNYDAYRIGLAGLPGIKLYSFDEAERNNFQYIIIEVDEILAGISRDILVKILHTENILARRYFYPGCHQMEPYRSYYPHSGWLLPETEKLILRVMSLPTGTAVQGIDIEQVCGLLQYIIRNSYEVTSKTEVYL